MIIIAFGISLVTWSVVTGRGVHGSGAPLTCDNALGVAVNETDAAGTWYLLHCFISSEVKCSEKNCLRFDLTTPQDRKQLSETYSPLLPEVKWEGVVLKIVTPCPVAELTPATPNYLEKTAPGRYRLITLPLVGSKPVAKIPIPRPVRLELVREEFLMMLDCVDMEPVVMVKRAPTPGYREHPVIKLLLEHAES